MWDRAIAAAVLSACLVGCAAPQDHAAARRDAALLAGRAGQESVLALNRAVEMVYEGSYIPALVELERLEEVFGQPGASSLAAEAIFWQGFCKERLGGLEEPMSLYFRCIRKAPSSRAAGQAAERFSGLQQVHEASAAGSGAASR